MTGVNKIQSFTLTECRKPLLITCFILLTLFTATISTLVITRTTNAATPTLSVQFTCAQAVDYKQGQICVHTQSKVALTMKVKYCSGYYAVSNSLKGTQYANAQGNHIWVWTPQTKCRGTATAYVTEQLSGRALNAIDNFIVK